MRFLELEYLLFIMWLPSKVVIGIRRSFVVIHNKKRNTFVIILDPSGYGFGNARVSSGKLCASVAKIWLFGPHSACSLIQPKLFASFISTSSQKSCAASVLELKKFS